MALLKQLRQHLLVLGVFMSLLTMPMVLSEPIDVRLNCTSVQPNCSSDQMLQSNDTIAFNVVSSCGNCTVNANTTQGFGIMVEIMMLKTWSIYDHFYILDKGTDKLMAFTGESEPCEISLNENNVQLVFQMTATIRIHSSEPMKYLCGNNTQHGNCNAVYNCRNFQHFDEVHAVKYGVVKSYFDLDGYMHPELYRQYGEFEHRAYMPMCPLHCVCSLSFQKLTAHCPDKKTVQILILYTKIALRFRLALDVTSRNIISISPGAFTGLLADRLCLGYNLLTRIESGTFQGIVTGLNSIEMEYNNISELPSDVFQGIWTLVYLQLRNNKISALHSDLFRYQGITLRWLDLSNNNFTTLMLPSLNRLRALSSLIMKNNNHVLLEPDVFLSQSSILYFVVLDQNQISSIQPGAFKGLDNVIRLHLKGNLLTSFESGVFDDLHSIQELILTRNKIIKIQSGILQPLQNLQSLDLSNNNISNLEPGAFGGLHELIGLKLHGNSLSHLESNVFTTNHLLDTNNTGSLPKLQFLLLNKNEIETIDYDVFQNMPSIEFVNIRDNPLKRVDRSSFHVLQNDTVIFVDEAATCCFIANNQCKANNPKAPYLTCQRLLPNITLQVFMWIFGVCALLGNASILIWRCSKHGRENIVQVLLIKNLAASDLLMGLYMLIIASADAYYRQFFPSEADVWRSGFVCKLAGMLSILSSEASVFFITLISIDRYLAIRYPRGNQRLTKKSAIIVLFALWLLAILLSVIPTSLIGIDSDFYDASEVCIGLPFVRSFLYHNITASGIDYEFTALDYISSVKELTYDSVYTYPESSSLPSQYYSIILFLGLNLACFLTVAVCYTLIFIIYKSASKHAGKSNRDEDITLAIRMGALVITDFICWMPIILIGILVQANLATISPVVYVYIVVFVLPINSAINPYLYTISKIISDKKRRPRQKKKPRPRKHCNVSQVGIINNGLEESAI